MLLPSGNPINYHEEVLSLQPMIPPKRFDTPPPVLYEGCYQSEGLDACSDFSLNYECGEITTAERLVVSCGSKLSCYRYDLIRTSLGKNPTCTKITAALVS